MSIYEQIKAGAYRKPPIVEAVIEIKFEPFLSPDQIEKVARRIEKDYFFNDSEQMIAANLDMQKKSASFTEASIRRKLSSLDRTEITIVQPEALLVSRLAPYTGWDTLFERLQRDWSALRRVAELLPTRVGVRYINRIDVPAPDSSPLQIERYLTVYPAYPNLLPVPMNAYAMQVAAPLGMDECNFTLNSGSVLPPLVNFTSFLLDLDIYREANLPRREMDLFALVAQIRIYKNAWFERMITDETRALFN